MKLRSFDDFGLPSSCTRDEGFHSWPLVAAIGNDALDEGKALSCPAQQQLRAIPVLNVGRVKVHVQEKAERIDKDVAFTAKDLLPRVIAVGIKRAPPFSAPLAL